MINKKRVDIFLEYLDQILIGKKDIGPVDDEEIERLLLLAKTMIATDFSSHTKIRDNMRKKLLVKLIESNKSSLFVSDRNDDELDEDVLEGVTAAGFAGRCGEQRDICPYCGSKKLSGKCSICNN